MNKPTRLLIKLTEILSKPGGGLEEKSMLLNAEAIVSAHEGTLQLEAHQIIGEVNTRPATAIQVVTGRTVHCVETIDEIAAKMMPGDVT